MKNKLKMQLLENYIKVMNIENFNKNMDISKLNLIGQQTYDETCRLNEKLKGVYERLLFKFGVMDDSFLVLKNEISRISYFATNLDLKLLEENRQNLVEMCTELKDIIKSLSLNECERNYIIYDVMCGC